MSPEPIDDRQALLTRVTNSLRKAETITSELRKTDSRLGLASISTSAGCTLVAGIAAALGPSLEIGTRGWQLVCATSAGLAFAATLSNGLSQQMKISDRLASANQCVGKLRALDVVMTTGSREWQDITAEYTEIAHTFPEFID